MDQSVLHSSVTNEPLTYDKSPGYIAKGELKFFTSKWKMIKAHLQFQERFDFHQGPRTRSMKTNHLWNVGSVICQDCFDIAPGTISFGFVRYSSHLSSSVIFRYSISSSSSSWKVLTLLMVRYAQHITITIDFCFTYCEYWIKESQYGIVRSSTILAYTHHLFFIGFTRSWFLHFIFIFSLKWQL